MENIYSRYTWDFIYSKEKMGVKKETIIDISK